MHTSDRLYVDDTSKVLGAKLSKSTRDFAFIQHNEHNFTDACRRRSRCFERKSVRLVSLVSVPPMSGQTHVQRPDAALDLTLEDSVCSALKPFHASSLPTKHVSSSGGTVTLLKPPLDTWQSSERI